MVKLTSGKLTMTKLTLDKLTRNLINYGKNILKVKLTMAKLFKRLN
jgi:hypothetical protein